MRDGILDTPANSAKGNSYAILPTKEEEARLQRQGAFWGPRTRQLFEAAGIGPGMTVLDLGSGVGDVALLAAELVGPIGCVVGVDINDRFVDIARARAKQPGTQT